MTKYLAIAFLITGFLVGDAYGHKRDGVYYCAETMQHGLDQYSVSSPEYFKSLNFIRKFKMEVTFPDNGNPGYIKNFSKGYAMDMVCESRPFTTMSCYVNGWGGVLFRFNTGNGRFSKFKGGPLEKPDETSFVMYGSCEKMD